MADFYLRYKNIKALEENVYIKISVYSQEETYLIALNTKRGKFAEKKRFEPIRLINFIMKSRNIQIKRYIGRIWTVGIREKG